MLKIFWKIISWLDGKKTTIGTVLSLINTYLFGRGVIQEDTAYLIAAILVAIGLGSNIATKQYYKLKTTSVEQ